MNGLVMSCHLSLLLSVRRINPFHAAPGPQPGLCLVTGYQMYLYLLRFYSGINVGLYFADSFLSTFLVYISSYSKTVCAGKLFAG